MRKLKYNRTAKDAYKFYAQNLLKLHPTWWGKYGQKIANFYIYSLLETGQIKEMMSYPRFKKILDEWFKGAKSYIIKGRALAMGSSLGRLLGVRVERNFGKKVVDWSKTRKKWNEQGFKKGLIYFTDDEWVRVGWSKVSHIKNEQYYRFVPAEGNSKSDHGFKKAFSLENRKDPLLRYNYKFKAFINNG